MNSYLVIMTLVVYLAALVGVGIWASGRTRNQDDYLLGGRALGGFVAAFSYSASASSAWTLLGLSGAGFVLGVQALWIALGATGTMLVAWFWVAPRLMPWTRERAQLTLPDFLADAAAGPWRDAIVVTSALIIVASFVMYIAAQLQGAGSTFASLFDLPFALAVVLGAAIILAYTLLGGFWAVSVTDTIQGLLMAVAAIVLPLGALAAIGGPGAFVQALVAGSSAEQVSLTGGQLGLAAVGVVFGSMAIGIGTFGQPQLLARFMALRDERARRQAAWLTTAWYAIVFFGMVFLGLAGRVLVPDIDNPENLFFQLAADLFHPLLAALLIAGVLSAIMSTADSQLLVAAAAISHDLGVARQSGWRAIAATRMSVLVVIAVAVLVALFLPAQIFDRVLSSWIALGSAFGPVLFWRLSGRTASAPAVLFSILAGYLLAVGLPLLPAAPGRVIERLLPFCLALAVLAVGQRPWVSGSTELAPGKNA